MSPTGSLCYDAQQAAERKAGRRMTWDVMRRRSVVGELHEL